MANPANINDVAEGFERPLTPYETTAASRWLDEAWVILRQDVPGVGARLELAADAPGYLEVDSVVVVLAAMVRRVLRNPEGRRAWSEDTYQETIDSVLSSGELYVSDREKVRLAPVLSGGGGGMYSIQLGR